MLDLIKDTLNCGEPGASNENNLSDSVSQSYENSLSGDSDSELFDDLDEMDSIIEDNASGSLLTEILAEKLKRYGFMF